ncbi:MAG: HDIG domain-containing protein [Gemmatimonadota bacterium]
MSVPQGRERNEDRGVLSTPPDKLWPDGVLHHGSRIVLLAVLAAAVTALFPPVERMRVGGYSEGEIADEDVYAEIPFEVPKTPEELARERQEARAAVPPTFDFRPEAADSMAARLDRFFVTLDSLAGAGGSVGEAMNRFLTGSSIELSPGQLQALQDGQTLSLVRQTALRATREILPEGVADGSQLEQFTTDRVYVREGAEIERTVPSEEILTPRDLLDRAVEMLPASAPPNVQEILRLVLINTRENSLELNIQATEQRREGAAQAVQTTRGEIKQNQIIVRANEPITAQNVETLQAYADALRAAGRLEEEGGVAFTPVLGAVLLNVILLSVFGLLLFLFRNEVYSRFRWVLLMGMVAAAYFGAAALVAGQGLPPELLPVAFVALAVAVLWDGRMALVLTIVLAVVTGVQPSFRGDAAHVIAVTLLGGASAALSVRAVRRRAQTWVFSAIIAAAYAGGILAFLLMGGLDAGDAGWAFLAAGANALLSAILAMGFLPVFELFTGITTDQTLLEWADPNRSLLKRLSLEAPGTYAHTINVANLAEAAANAVDANGLLCRVGLYYHDVGKMLKPHYFVENQPEGRNPHDRLKPDTSAAIVKEHVTEGYKLARDANVPDIVSDFIVEHHGTQRIGFFWEKAREEYGEDQLDVDDFTYPGPKPRSKETAIAMLADSVESATRALQDPTPERVRSLIENLVDSKIADGQLDDSPLTLREIRQIKEQFIKVLSGIYHHRIDYPATKHLTEKEEGGEDRAAGSDAGSGSRGDGTGGEAQGAEGTADRGQGEPAASGAAPEASGDPPVG